MSFDLDILADSDVLDSSEIKEKKEANKNINEAGSQIEAQTGIIDVKPDEWKAIVVFYKSKGYPTYHKNISLPEKCYKMHVGGGLPSDKQSAEALRIRQKAYSEGFDFI